MEKAVVIIFLFLLFKNINGYNDYRVETLEKYEQKKWKTHDEEIRSYTKTGFKSIKCRENAECQDGLSCINGLCNEEALHLGQQQPKLIHLRGLIGDLCTFHSDCPGLLMCRNGICQSSTGGSSGHSCIWHSDCPGLLMCRNRRCQSETNGEYSSCTTLSDCPGILWCIDGICQRRSSNESSSSSGSGVGLVVGLGFVGVILLLIGALIKRARKNTNFESTRHARPAGSSNRMNSNPIASITSNPSTHFQPSQQPSQMSYPNNNLPTYEEAMRNVQK